MDNMSVWQILFISFPEELLIVITTLAIAGYKDVLNFKDKKNLFKLLISTTLLVISTVLGRTFLPFLALNTLIQIFVYYLIIILVYRYKFIACIYSLFFSILIIFIGETILFYLPPVLFNISLTQIVQKSFLRFIFTLPTRILQIIVVFLIFKIKNFNTTLIKLSKKEFLNMIIFLSIFLTNMYLIENTLKNSPIDSSPEINIMISISITGIYFIWLLYNIISLRNQVKLKNKLRDFELNAIRKLLTEGNAEKVMSLIDIALNRKDEAE